MPELCTDIQAANFPERSVQAAAPEGWVELVGMWCGSGHLLGTVLNAFPSVWGSAAAAKKKCEILAGSSPWGCSLWHQGWLGVAGTLTGFGPLQAQVY